MYLDFACSILIIKSWHDFFQQAASLPIKHTSINFIGKQQHNTVLISQSSRVRSLCEIKIKLVGCDNFKCVRNSVIEKKIKESKLEDGN